MLMMSDDEDDCEAGASGPLTSYAWVRTKLDEYFDWCGGKGDKVDTAKKMWSDFLFMFFPFNVQLMSLVSHRND